MRRTALTAAGSLLLFLSVLTNAVLIHRHWHDQQYSQERASKDFFEGWCGGVTFADSVAHLDERVIRVTEEYLAERGYECYVTKKDQIRAGIASQENKLRQAR